MGIDQIGTIIFCVILVVGFGVFLIEDTLAHHKAKQQLEECRKNGHIGMLR